MPFILLGKFEEKNSISILDAIQQLQSPSQGLTTQVISVGTSPTPLPDSPYSQRKVLVVRNTDENQTLLIGSQTDLYYSIEPKQFIALDLPASLTLYGKVNSGTINVEIMEIG